MGLNLDYSDGQTPLDEDEKEGLMIETIATRGELDEFEQQNIEEALQWLIHKSFKVESILSEKFIRDLHKRMYGRVWQWAGTFRNTNKNLEIDKWQIAVEFRKLCDDTLFWIINDTYPPDEIAIRFKHRLISIHCFPNGNGRHSRLMADIIREKIFHLKPYSWGAGNLMQTSDLRSCYIAALQMADRGDMNDLIQFAKS